MRRSVRAVAAVGVGVVGLAAVVAGSVVAQDGEPAGGDGRTVPPEECVAEPRPADEVVALLTGEDEGRDRRPPVQVPFGEVAGGGIADEVTVSVRQVLACVNAGDPGRAAAGLSDYGVRRFWLLLGGEETEAEAIAARLAEEPQPLAEENRIRVLEVTDVARLEGGRVVALVVLNDPRRLPRGPETLLMTFMREGERFLLDDFLVFTTVSANAAGTPAAGASPAGTPAAE